MTAIDALKSIKEWFTSLGWFANALTICVVTVPALIATRARLQALIGFSTFSQVAAHRIVRNGRQDTRKSIVEVAIVDDDPDDFPVEELRREGFHIKVYKQVRLNEP